MTKVRTDQHSPLNFDPGEYSYVGHFYQGGSHVAEAINSEEETIAAWAAWEASGWKDGNFATKNTCDHCGAAFAYGTFWRHDPTGVIIGTGWICAADRFNHDSKAAYAVSRMKKQVKEAKERQKMEAAAVAAIEKHEGLAAALETDHYIVRDIKAKVFRYGNISENQVKLVFKIVAEEAEREAAKAQREAALTHAADLLAERRVVTGRVVSTKYQDSFYGTTRKMLVEMPDGNRVWGTVPGSIDSEVESGVTVRFVATIEPSDDDSHFGFFTRPTKGEVVALEAV